MKKIKISPSILSADFSSLGKEIKILEKAGADSFHFDIMDGHFVPNLTFGAVILSSLRDKTNIPFNAHLMVEEPINFIDDFILAGADIISVHWESTKYMHPTIRKIKEGGKKVAVAISPSTPACVLDPLLADIDIVIIMSVNPGFAGQKFISTALDKIAQVKRKITEKNLKVEIEVDGGINDKTAPLAISEGADILVSASYLFQKGENIKELIRKLRISGER